MEAPDLRPAHRQARIPRKAEAGEGFRTAAHGAIALRYSPSADALVIRYAQGSSLHTADLGGERYLDYSDDGRVLSIEVLGAGEGVDLEGVPRAGDVAAALVDLGLPAE